MSHSNINNAVSMHISVSAMLVLFLNLLETYNRYLTFCQCFPDIVEYIFPSHLALTQMARSIGNCWGTPSCPFYSMLPNLEFMSLEFTSSSSILPNAGKI